MHKRISPAFVVCTLIIALVFAVIVSLYTSEKQVAVRSREELWVIMEDYEAGNMSAQIAAIKARSVVEKLESRSFLYESHELNEIAEDIASAFEKLAEIYGDDTVEEHIKYNCPWFECDCYDWKSAIGEYSVGITLVKLH